MGRFLTQILFNSFKRCKTSSYLFLLEWMLVVCVFQCISLFHLSFEIYRHSVVCSPLLSINVCNIVSFLMVAGYDIMWIYHNLFNHSVIVEHLGYFCFFTIINICVMSIHVYTCFVEMSNSFRYISRSGLYACYLLLCNDYPQNFMTENKKGVLSHGLCESGF